MITIGGTRLTRRTIDKVQISITLGTAFAVVIFVSTASYRVAAKETELESVAGRLKNTEATVKKVEQRQIRLCTDMQYIKEAIKRIERHLESPQRPHRSQRSK